MWSLSKEITSVKETASWFGLRGKEALRKGCGKDCVWATSGRKLVLIAQSCLTLCNPIFVACQVHPSMEFSRQEHWSGLPFPSPGKEAKKVRKLQLAIDRVCVHAGLTASRVFCYLSLSQQWSDVIPHLHKRKGHSVLLLLLHCGWQSNPLLLCSGFVLLLWKCASFTGPVNYCSRCIIMAPIFQ